MAGLGATSVQRGPFRVPIEGNALGTLVQVVQALDGIELDTTGSIEIEEAEGDLVLGVRLGEEVFEGGPVGDVQLASPASVCDVKEDAILLALDLVLLDEWVSLLFFHFRASEFR